MLEIPRRGRRARHALRNSAIPIVTLAGLEIGQLFGGTLVAGFVEGWPSVVVMRLADVSRFPSYCSP